MTWKLYILRLYYRSMKLCSFISPSFFTSFFWLKNFIGLSLSSLVLSSAISILLLSLFSKVSISNIVVFSFKFSVHFFLIVPISLWEHLLSKAVYLMKHSCDTVLMSLFGDSDIWAIWGCHPLSFHLWICYVSLGFYMLTDFGLYPAHFQYYILKLSPIKILWKILNFYCCFSSWSNQLGSDYTLCLPFCGWEFQCQVSFLSLCYECLLTGLGPVQVAGSWVVVYVSIYLFKFIIY